jgi:hypothetical protein
VTALRRRRFLRLAAASGAALAAGGGLPARATPKVGVLATPYDLLKNGEDLRLVA